MKQVKLLSIVMALAMTAAFALTAGAEENNGGWKFSVGNTLWTPSINAKLTAGGRSLKQNLDIPDVLEKYNGGLLLDVVAQKDKFFVSMDSLNYQFTGSKYAASESGDANWWLTVNWLQAQSGYYIVEEKIGEKSKLSLAPTVGYRYYWNRIQMDHVSGGELADKRSNWGDVIFGGRAVYDINEKFALITSGTYGGFGWGHSSEHSWTAGAAVDWHFCSNKTLRVGYMAIDVKKQKNVDPTNTVSMETTIQGPTAALIWHF